jgi:4-hydroxy-tetrahydrodipicolinate synthase
MALDLRGIYAAAVTPFDEAARPSYEQFQKLLTFLAKQGCHGVFVSGTTGEGPSLTVEERIGLFAAAAASGSDLRLIAGTGAASLEDAKQLSRAAFEHGAAAIAVIPPFFYANPPLDGLVAFYDAIIKSIPSDGILLLYHNPAVSAPLIDLELISQLVERYPDQVRGLKDSSGDWSYTSSVLDRFPDFQVFVGNDRFLAQAVDKGAAGAITALATAFPALLRDVYDAAFRGDDTQGPQTRVVNAQKQLDGLPRIAAIKWVLKMAQIIENDAVRPPNRGLTDAEIDILDQRFSVHVQPADWTALVTPPDPDEL